MELAGKVPEGGEMNEASHYGPLWTGANQMGWHLFRIADGSVGKKPADIAGVSADGVGVLIEVKLVHGRTTEELSAPLWPVYEVHQKAWLRKYTEARAIAIAAEYDTLRREMHLWLMTDPRQVDAKSHSGFAFPWHLQFHKASDRYLGWPEVAAAHKSLLWNPL